MTESIDVNVNLYKGNSPTEEFNKDPAEAMVPMHEEIPITKNEVKEELYDFEMSEDKIEFVNVKEEPTFSSKTFFEEENFELIANHEQSLVTMENLVSGQCQLRGEDLQEEQKLSKKYLHLKCKGQAKNTLKTHLLIKQDGKLKKYKCADCKYTTHTNADLKRHIRTHTNERPYKCTYKNCKCIAGQEESCKCDMCGYAATDGSNLKKHILAKHSKEPKKYKCADCKYTSHENGDLKRHIRTHTNDKPFKCTYKNCSCTATQEELCKCDMCVFAAAVESNLKMHILRKHSGKPKQYKCADCNYTAHLKPELNRHIRTHTNDKPFKCKFTYVL